MSNPSLTLAGAVALDLLGFRPLPPAGGSPLVRRMFIDYSDLMDAIHSVALMLLRVDREHPELGLREAMLRILDRPVDEDTLRFIRSSLAVLAERARPFWPKPPEAAPSSTN